jgi:hypothetical protein
MGPIAKRVARNTQSARDIAAQTLEPGEAVEAAVLAETRTTMAGQIVSKRTVPLVSTNQRVIGLSVTINGKPRAVDSLTPKAHVKVLRYSHGLFGGWLGDHLSLEIGGSPESKPHRINLVVPRQARTDCAAFVESLGGQLPG